MTFYEAALRVLESAGHPLNYLEITQQAIAQNLLSHVGKTPEQTMLSRLAAMARRPRDRRVIVTAKDTFGLLDWAVPEDPAALAITGVVEPNPEEALPPLRPPERHPEPRQENVRAVGRGERKRRHEEEDRGKRRRFPPIAEVAFEILSESEGGLKPEELAGRAVERELAGEELGTEQILRALLDDNQRRIDAGRRPQFVLDRALGQLTLERAGTAPEVSPADLQAAFAMALGIPFEGGRPVLVRVPERAGESAADLQLVQTARAAIKDARRAMARVLRRKLAELELGTFEKSVIRLLQELSFRDLKVAKRSKEGPLLTARKREGSVELRYAIKLSKGSAPVDRRAVQELRRDLGHYAAQVGIFASPGDVRGDARAEAQSQGALVMLWCSEGLAEKFFEASAGVKVQQAQLFEIDERFFEQSRLEAEESRVRREDRQRERGSAEEERPAAPAVVTVAAEPEEVAEATVPAERPAEVSGDAEAEEGVPAERVEGISAEAVVAAEEGEEEGELEDEEEGELEPGGTVVTVAGAPSPGGQPLERKRRRRRRRGRRGKGPRPGEAPAPGAAAAPSAGEPTAGAAPDSNAPPPAPPSPPAPPAGGEGQ